MFLETLSGYRTERDLADYKLLFLNKHWVFVIPKNCQIEEYIWMIFWLIL